MSELYAKLLLSLIQDGKVLPQSHLASIEKLTSGALWRDAFVIFCNTIHTTSSTANTDERSLWELLLMSDLSSVPTVVTKL